jgi:putative nucleotidyltransferase with HDIG domain
MDHYHRSLTAFTKSGHERGQAIAYHNLGMISADKAEWDDADDFFRQATDRAEEQGDQHLRALCLLNHCEVFIARQNYTSAKEHAENALQVLTQIGDQAGQSAAYRFLGTIYRETGKRTLAEARLRQSLDLSRAACSPLDQAEALWELALLFQDQGRSAETLKTLNESRCLFQRLDAKLDRLAVAKKIAELERTFMEVVRDWSVSIESADRYTHGHCERVASYAAELADRLGLSPTEQTTVRVGAYLHDLGKLNVPHEILNKPGPLTEAEFEIMKKHPVWGLEMLALVDFPWDIQPIIRWHHEKVDGSGYPDGLSGDAIPLEAQIISIADTFDAMTTKRSYRNALSHDQALVELEACRHCWSPKVYEAFLASIEADRVTEPSKYLRMKLALDD